MDRGPWTPKVWKRQAGRVVMIHSCDGVHDVSLELCGDFADWAERIKYANWLAEVLTRATVNGFGDGNG